ncbi:hypothetical protein CF326_g4227 [Tilletia indica]|nr:hypothetical protein CF326_g4227 [Tilletia indica]
MSSPLSVVPESDWDSELSDLEELPQAPSGTSDAMDVEETSSSTQEDIDDNLSDAEMQTLDSSESHAATLTDTEMDDDLDDVSSLSELSSDQDDSDAQSTALVKYTPPTPVKRGRGRPRKRPIEEVEQAEPAKEDVAHGTRRSLRAHGLPPLQVFENLDDENAPKASTSQLDVRQTRSGATRTLSTPDTSLSSSDTSVTRTRSGRELLAPAAQAPKPARSRVSSSSFIDVSIGPSQIDTSDFTAGGDPNEYAATSSSSKRRRISSTSRSKEEASGSQQSNGESSQDKVKRKKVKNRGWSRSGSSKTSKADASSSGSSAPRTSRKRLFRADPCMDYLAEAFSLNENGGEEFQFNGDAQSVPFPFTFRVGQAAQASSSGVNEDDSKPADATDEGGSLIEMPLQGPQSVVEVSSKVPLKIPATWIPPLPPRAVKYLERQQRREERAKFLANKLEAIIEEETDAAADVEKDGQGEAQAPAIESTPTIPSTSTGAEARTAPMRIGFPAEDVVSETVASAPLTTPAVPSTSTGAEARTAPMRIGFPAEVTEAEDSAIVSTRAVPDTSTVEAASAPPQADDCGSDDSDVESDDGISPLRPSHFYPTPGGSDGFPGVPIFTPTMKQFSDFYSFAKRINDWGMRTGIVKVIPPQEWKDQQPDLNQELDAKDQTASKGKGKEKAQESHCANADCGKKEPSTEEKIICAAFAIVAAEDEAEQAASAPEPSSQRDAPEGLSPKAGLSKPSTSSSANGDPSLRSIRIRNVIRQLVLAVGSGAYSQTNLTTPNKVWNVKQWADICASEGQRGPELERMKRKIDSLKAGADALNANGLSGYRRKKKDGVTAEELREILKETEGVRTRSGRKHRTARDEEADDEREENDNEDTTTGADDKSHFGKQPRAAASTPAAPSPPRSDHSSVGKGDHGASHPHHALTPPASHANDGSDRSDHHAGSPPATSTETKTEVSTSADISTEADSSLPGLESASPSKPKKVSMPDRTTTAEWDAFDYKNCWLKEAMSLDESEGDGGHPGAGASSSKTVPKATDWTIDVCREIEGEYWRNLTTGKPAMYGADLPGTLFRDDMDCWNVGKLDNPLTRMPFRRKLLGVTTPYLYLGQWRATFAWHLEDMDLYSINYIHFGAPKQWYAIPQTDRQRFETVMASAFPTDARKCAHFMRHKSYLVSPSYLARNNIKPLKLVQHAGEFVITYPYGYHSGYNLGFNCAESVNFALDTWFEIGRNAGFCKCRTDSVQMDVEAFLREAFEENEARAKKEMEDAEKKEKARLKKESTAAGKGKRKASDAGLGGESSKLPKTKKAKKDVASSTGAGASSVAETSGADVDGNPSAAKKANRPKGFPCVFCVSMIEDDMVPVPPSAVATAVSPKLEQGSTEAHLASEGANKPATGPASKGKLPATTRYAHRLCANILPETWVRRETEIVKVMKTVRKEKTTDAGVQVANAAMARRSPASIQVGPSKSAAEVVPSSDDEDAEVPSGTDWKGATGSLLKPIAVPSSDSGDEEAPVLFDRDAEAVADALLHLNGGASVVAGGGHGEMLEEVEEEVVKVDEVMGFDNIERARWALKCSLCPTAPLAKHGCKVQCTRAKCSRAAHVTCANLADSGWHVAFMKKEEADKLEFGGVRSKKGAKTAKGSGKGAVATSASAAPLGDAAMGSIPSPGPSTSTSTDAGIAMASDLPASGGEAESNGDNKSGEDERLVLLCRSHNPEVKKAEAIRRALALREQCLALRPMSLINVRAGSNSGVWQVLLLEVHDVPGGEDAVRAGMAPTTKGEILVMYDGQRHRIKWGRIEFGVSGTGTGVGGSNGVGLSGDPTSRLMTVDGVLQDPSLGATSLPLPPTGSSGSAAPMASTVEFGEAGMGSAVGSVDGRGLRRDPMAWLMTSPGVPQGPLPSATSLSLPPAGSTASVSPIYALPPNPGPAPAMAQGYHTLTTQLYPTSSSSLPLPPTFSTGFAALMASTVEFGGAGMGSAVGGVDGRGLRRDPMAWLMTSPGVPQGPPPSAGSVSLPPASSTASVSPFYALPPVPGPPPSMAQGYRSMVPPGPPPSAGSYSLPPASSTASVSPTYAPPPAPGPTPSMAQGYRSMVPAGPPPSAGSLSLPPAGSTASVTTMNYAVPLPPAPAPTMAQGYRNLTARLHPPGSQHYHPYRRPS